MTKLAIKNNLLVLTLLIIIANSIFLFDVVEARLLQPEDFRYLGAFNLPDGGLKPLTFAYGGDALTFNPEGNAQAIGGGLPGSLFVMGHSRLPYGEMLDGNQVAEITIPWPLIRNDFKDLNTAVFLQPFTDVAQGYFSSLAEIPRVGMEYLKTPLSGAQIHLAWGQHMQPELDIASHACFAPDLTQPRMLGPWFVGQQSMYSVTEYIFEIPVEWAEKYGGGRLLATGRFKDGGWSGMGPALIAYWPWLDGEIEPPPSGSFLDELVLLLYASSEETNQIEKCLMDYQHGDEWKGGAWLTSAAGKEAVLFVGTKSVGEKYWYGYINPQGPQYPFVEEAFINDFVVCRLSCGTPCPDPAAALHDQIISDRGWWSTAFAARFLLYDPQDFALVAQGKLEPWEPQPYAFMDVDDLLFLNPEGIDQWTLGWGDQRRYRLGDVAFDRNNGYLYVLELFVDQGKPLIHVWQLQ